MAATTSGPPDPMDRNRTGRWVGSPWQTAQHAVTIHLDPAFLTRVQVDGAACIKCGRRSGALIPVGSGPYGLVFAHPGRC